MKILILGAGAVGGYFGGRMALAGADVTFAVRPARHRALMDKGLAIQSPHHGDFTTPIKTISTVDQHFDVVIIACKAYDLAEAMETVMPAVGPQTLVLPTLNGIRHLDLLDAKFGRARVVGGCTHIGVTLNEKRDVVHFNALHYFTIGARDATQQERCLGLHEIMERSGFDAVLSTNILQDMWEKFVYLAAYAGMTCLMRTTIGKIASTPDGAALTLAFLEECTQIGRAAGYMPRASFLEKTREKLTDRNSEGTSSMLRDLLRNTHTEADHILNDMRARADMFHIPAPLLRMACTNLQIYENTLV